MSFTDFTSKSAWFYPGGRLAELERRAPETRMGTQGVLHAMNNRDWFFLSLFSTLE
jgi:hypothetical protein